MHFFHSVRLSHWRVSLRFTLRKIRSLEIPSGSFLEFRFKISFSRNFSASLVTRLGALRSGFAFTFVLRNFASWILLAVQAKQLHFKSAKMHFFHSVWLSHWRVSLRFTLRLLLPKSLILCKMGPLGGQNPLSWILLAVRFSWLRF